MAPQSPLPFAPDLGQISPELVLVSPELAASARALLPEPPDEPVDALSELLSASVMPSLAELRRVAESAEPEPVPRPKRIRRLAIAGLGCFVAVGILTSGLAAERREDDRASELSPAYRQGVLGVRASTYPDRPPEMP